MNKKLKYIIFSFVAFIVLFMGASFFMAKDQIWFAYCLAMDSMMKEDIGLNYEMKYIAIDMDSLKGIKESDKESILKFFEKYNVDIVEESFHSLKKKGMVKEGNSLDGILLSIQSKKGIFPFSSFESSKFKSGLGAIGVESNLIFLFGRWKLINSRTTSIS